jgi:hypothetical protein
MYGKNAIAPKMAPTRKVESVMAALRYTYQSIGLSEESQAIRKHLLFDQLGQINMTADPQRHFAPVP